MADIHTIKCKECDEGMMTGQEIASVNRFIVYFLIGIGVLFTMTVIGSIIGVPLIMFALKLGSKKNVYWVCDKCQAKIIKHT